MAVDYKQFEAEFGFKSPFFSVDDQGNVTLRSITYIVPPDEEVDLTPDYRVTEQNSDFFISELSSSGVTIDVIRGSEYVFELSLSTLSFNLYDGAFIYNDGIQHTINGTDFAEGLNAQNKSSGFIILSIPADAPDTLTIRNISDTASFFLNVQDPVFTGNGNFNNITATGDVNLIGTNNDIVISPTGSSTLTISPPSGSMSNMNIIANTLSAIDTVTLSPTNRDVTISPTNNGRVNIDSGTTGSLNNINIGEFTPGTGNFTSVQASAGNLNNVIIGDEIPTSANFTSIGLSQSPVNKNDVANKQYVDNAVVALAIAFGL